MSEPLQQLSDDLCRGLSGWKLQPDKHALERLGSGLLEIDLLNKTCRFEHDYVPRLAIIDALDLELRRFLEGDGVGPEGIRSAVMEIRLTIEEREDQKDKSVMWFGENDGFVGCEMEIQCTVSMDDKSSESEHTVYVEWPRETNVRL